MSYSSLARQVALLFLLFAAIPLNIFGLPPRPNPPRLVNEFVPLLSAAEKESLETRLVQYANSHGTQIAVVVTTDLAGLEIGDYAARLGEKWGVGEAGRENGIVIVVVPGDELGRRLVFIAVGYGLEGVIPDLTAKQIIDHEIVPHFREGNYYFGLNNAINVLMQLSAGEFTAKDYAAAKQEVPGVNLIPLIIAGLFFFVFTRQRRGYASVGRRMPFWTMFWLLTHANRGRGGTFGNFTSGTGGFGGFGGGRFGGGGAGGSW